MIALFLAVDALANGWGASLFLARKFLALLASVEFWR